MRLTLLLIFSLLKITLSAQVSINEDNSQADDSAILELKSTTKGFLPPRMTTDEIRAIPSPEAGLMVFNNTTMKPYYYNGNIWISTDGSDALTEVGDFAYGGIIFYTEDSGVHGLVVSMEDSATDASFGCKGIDLGAHDILIGTGKSNTEIIINNCVEAGIAAKIADAYSSNDYGDWFLPSRNELYQLREVFTTINPFIVTNGGIAVRNDVIYLSSSEASPGYTTSAFGINFAPVPEMFVIDRVDKSTSSKLRFMKSF